MEAVDIPAEERAFRQNGTDSEGRRHTLTELSVPIPGDSQPLKVVRCKPASGDTSYYYAESWRKERVVVHFTAGYLRGDVHILSRPQMHVSVPFLVARDGTIYNLYPSGYWSYHLGPGALGGNRTMSRSSVAIEVSNIGPLVRQGDDLVTVYGKKYCRIGDTQFYTRQTYRGYLFYASFTDAQYDSVIRVLRYATGRYNIPRQFLPENIRYERTERVLSYHGIATHVNYRTDKFDIGPAFDWDRVSRGVTAP